MLFFLSGASSLVYEILWMRMFTQVFGNTTAATSTVLAAFMAGLALGSYLIGSYVDRHPCATLKLYAYLEGMIGVFGLLMPLLIKALYVVYGWVFRTFPDTFFLLDATRFSLSLLLILIPTTLMGATLPVLSKHFVSSHHAMCRWVGLLYGANTLGAVAGSFVSGFFLIAWLGVTRTTHVAAGANFLIAFLALALAPLTSPNNATLTDSAERGQDVATVTGGTENRGIRRLLLAVCFGSGFSALAYEVLWTRLLVFVLDSTVYAFCTMLTTFLFGIALGGFLISGIHRKIGDHVRWLGVLEILIGLTGFATIMVISRMEYVDPFVRRLIMRVSYGGWWTTNALKFIEAFSIMLVPTIFMGMAFPLICKVYTRDIKELGGSIGTVYAINTFGAVLGALGAGFLMIPLVGITKSITLIAAVGVILGGLLLLQSATRATVWLFNAGLFATVVFVGFVVVSPDVLSGVYTMPERGSRLAYYHEGKSGTVTIHHYPPNERLLSVNGTNVAGTQFSLRTTQKLQAHIPMLLHGRARKVLQIGFGSGESCHVLSLYPVERIDLVEIDADVIKASDEFFHDLNKGIVNYPAFRPIIMDGKNYAMLTDEKYDVIMNDSTYPGKSGSASLYTRDHFLACRRLLSEGGVMSSWVPFEIHPMDFKSIVRTFQSVFPHTTLWLASNCRNKHALMVGTVGPLSIDVSRVAELMNIPEVKVDLEQIRLGTPHALLASLVLTPAMVEEYCIDAPVNSDEYPTLEFSAGRHPTIMAYWVANHNDFVQFRSSIVPHLRFSKASSGGTNEFIKTIIRSETVNTHLDRARLYDLMDEAKGVVKKFRILTLEQREEYEKALQIDPNDENVRFFLAEGDASLAALEKLAATEPANPVILFNLGRAYRGQRMYAAAINAFSMALSRDSANTDYRSALETAFLEFKRANPMQVPEPILLKTGA